MDKFDVANMMQDLLEDCTTPEQMDKIRDEVIKCVTEITESQKRYLNIPKEAYYVLLNRETI